MTFKICCAGTKDEVVAQLRAIQKGKVQVGPDPLAKKVAALLAFELEQYADFHHSGHMYSYVVLAEGHNMPGGAPTELRMVVTPHWVPAFIALEEMAPKQFIDPVVQDEAEKAMERGLARSEGEPDPNNSAKGTPVQKPVIIGDDVPHMEF